LANLAIDENGLLIYDTNTYLSESSLVSASSSGTYSVVLQNLQVNSNTTLKSLICNNVNYSNIFSIDTSTEWLNIYSTTNLNGSLNVSQNFIVNGVDYGSNFSNHSTTGWLQVKNSIVFHDNVTCDSNFTLSYPQSMNYTTVPY
jgi:hypothetical protein